MRVLCVMSRNIHIWSESSDHEICLQKMLDAKLTFRNTNPCLNIYLPKGLLAFGLK